MVGGLWAAAATGCSCCLLAAARLQGRCAPALPPSHPLLAATLRALQHRYFDAVVNNARGGAQVIRRALCMKEEDAGMAWKHYEYRNGTPRAEESLVEPECSTLACMQAVLNPRLRLQQA